MREAPGGCSPPGASLLRVRARRPRPPESSRGQSSRSTGAPRKARLGEPYSVVVVVVDAVVDVVELVDAVVVVVAPPPGQAPSSCGFFALNSLSAWFLIWLSGPNWTEYRSPAPAEMPSFSATHPLVPGSGGMMFTGPFLPATFALMVN